MSTNRMCKKMSKDILKRYKWQENTHFIIIPDKEKLKGKYTKCPKRDFILRKHNSIQIHSVHVSNNTALTHRKQISINMSKQPSQLVKKN